MVALVLAEACLEKFGGDSLSETSRNHAAYLAAIPAAMRTLVTDSEWRPLVVLVGPPGSPARPPWAGALAERLGVPLHDTDAAIEATAGRRSPTSSSSDGEPAFRALERAEVARALAEDAGVLALGGGALWTRRPRRLLAGHTVVFLDVGIADASKRVGFDRPRPLLAVNPRASWVG